MSHRALLAALAAAASVAAACGGGGGGQDRGPIEEPAPRGTLVADLTVDRTLAPSPFATADGARVAYDPAARAQRVTWTRAAPGQFAGFLLAGPWDLSASDLFALEVGFERAEAQAAVELVAHFDDDPSRPGARSATAVVAPAGDKLPRATYTFPKASFTPSGAADWSAVKHLEVRLRRGDRAGVSGARVYRLWADVTTRPRVLLTFDDATHTAYAKAFPILRAAGLRATVYAAGNLVGSDPWFMTLDQLKELYAAGWDVGSHSWSHQAFTQEIWGYWRSGTTATIAFSQPHAYRPGDRLAIAGCDAAEYDGVKIVETVPDAQTITFATPGLEEDEVARGFCHVVGGVPAETVREELRRNRDWLAASGFLRAKDHLAYPYGAWDPAAIAIWRDELGGRSARVVGPSNAGRFVLPPLAGADSPYLLPSWDLDDRATAAAALAQVDAAIAAGASIVFLGHGVADADPYPTQMRTAELQGFVDGLAARRDAGLVDVVTISEWARDPAAGLR